MKDKSEWLLQVKQMITKTAKTIQIHQVKAPRPQIKPRVKIKKQKKIRKRITASQLKQIKNLPSKC